MRTKYGKAWKTVFANDNTALSPEMWAQESLMVLEANMVACNLVYREFQNEIAKFGDVVNADKPGSFTMKRKTDGDDVSVQDATATTVPVRLDQHNHVSFIIYDGEESKSFKELVAYHLTPALVAMAKGMDQVVLGQGYDFMGNSVGKLGTDVDKSTIIAANALMNTNLAPTDGHNMLISPNVEADLLNVSDFTKVNEAGDGGTALRKAHLGQKFNLEFYMSQNVPSVPVGNTIEIRATVNGAHAAGATAIAITHGSCGAITAGTWCTIGGDMVPQLITGSTGSTTPTAIAISPGLKSAVLTSAAITMYTPGAVNNVSNYAQYWSKPLVVNGFSVAPKVGQLVSFGVTNPRYGALSTPTTTSLLLNRSLDAGVSNADVIGIGPKGEYCFGFHRNAIALVTRPLAQPMASTGVKSYVASYNGLSIRVCISYDPYKQGHLVTVDLLAGVKTLDTNLGVVMYA